MNNKAIAKQLLRLASKLVEAESISAQLRKAINAAIADAGPIDSDPPLTQPTVSIRKKKNGSHRLRYGPLGMPDSEKVLKALKKHIKASNLNVLGIGSYDDVVYRPSMFVYVEAK